MQGQTIQVEYDGAAERYSGVDIESASAFFVNDRLTVIGEASSKSGAAITDYRELQMIAYDGNGCAVAVWLRSGR